MTAPPSDPDTPGTHTPPSSRDQALVELAAEMRTFLTGMAEMIDARERRERSWTTIKRTGGLLAVLALVTTWVALYAPMFGWSRAPTSSVVSVIPINGPIAQGSAVNARAIVPLIDRACRSSMSSAVILSLNSPGGSPSQADLIGEALRVCKQDGRSIPVIAVIEGTGASATYLIAAQADEIYANRYALVGSLGAVMRSFDAGDLAERMGVRERVFTSGPLKSGNSPWSENTPEQDSLNQELVDGLAQVFADQVLELRAGRIQDDPELFTGRLWTAQSALDLGLIDGIASLEELRLSRFQGAPVHEYRPRATFHDRLGLTALVRTFAAQLAASLREPVVD